MANYNTFVVVDCTTKKNILVTSSARKSASELWKGRRVEVWNENTHTDTVYARHKHNLDIYIRAEKAYIGVKQGIPYGRR